GNFKNAWYDYARDHRAALVSEPLKMPDQDSEHTRHWAAFCAASVEFLCDRYGLACPAWVFDPAYTVATPWHGDTIVNLTHALLAIASSIGDESMPSMDHSPRCAFEVEERKKSAKQEISHLLRRRTYTAVHPYRQGR